MKELKATRVPPGDRWSIVDGGDDKIYSSLTEVLNQIFMETQMTEFYMKHKKVKFISRMVKRNHQRLRSITLWRSVLIE